MPNHELLSPSTEDAYESNRYLWGLWDMYWDPASATLTPVPKRNGEIHLNIRRFLEDNTNLVPCTDCLTIGKNFINPDGDLDVEIDIRHPLDDKVFAGFDVRGIVIFPGTCFFKEFGLLTANATIGSQEYQLVNADGYTELWSQIKFDEGTIGRPIFEYSDGTWAWHKQILPTSLNAFIAHYTNNNRRAFDADSHNLEHYVIKMPAELVSLQFGYAVDASWAQPLVDPNPVVPDDFPPQANSLEAYKIDVQENGVLTDIGGSLELTIQVFDWQDADKAAPDTIQTVQVESPELFGDTGIVDAVYDQKTDNHFDYKVTLSNEDKKDPGFYPLLVAVTDSATIPIIGGILQHTRAYQVFMLQVHPELELEDSIPVDNAPIEAEFDTGTTSCFLSQFVGDDDRAIRGIDSALEIIDSFPDTIATGTIGVCTATGEIYLATDYGSGWTEDVTVFDINTGNMDYSFDIPSLFGKPGCAPVDFSVHQNAQEVWVSLYNESQVAYFPAGEELPDIKRVDVGNPTTDPAGPTTLLIDQANYVVFAACELKDTVAVIDGWTHAVDITIDLVTPLESPIPPAPAAPGMAYIDSLDRLYVATLLEGKLDFYTVSTGQYEGTIQLATGLYVILGVIYDPVSNLIFVTGQSAAPNPGLIYVIDPETNEVESEIETSMFNPSFPALDQANRRLFVPDPIGYVDVFKIN
jgi:hypothetical protein